MKQWPVSDNHAKFGTYTEKCRIILTTGSTKTRICKHFGKMKGSGSGFRRNQSSEVLWL